MPSKKLLFYLPAVLRFAFLSAWVSWFYLPYLITVNSMIRIIKIIARYGLVSLKSTQAIFSSLLKISFRLKDIIMIPGTAELIMYIRLSE